MKEENMDRPAGYGDVGEMSHGYWSKRAEEFSRLRMKDYDSPMREAFFYFLKENLPSGRGMGRNQGIRALDIGCGAGFFSLFLDKLGCQVTAVDFSEEMLEQARINAREKGCGDIRFLQMDAQNLEFEDGVFDFIVTRNVTWILPDTKKAYSEMLRVLKPGGRLINMDANYGQVFNAADARGEQPSHPTQSQEQLRLRNRIASGLDITKAARPQWDIMNLWEDGISSIRCIRDVEEYLGIKEWNQNYTRASAGSKAVMFAVIADK